MKASVSLFLSFFLYFSLYLVDKFYLSYFCFSLSTHSSFNYFFRLWKTKIVYTLTSLELLEFNVTLAMNRYIILNLSSILSLYLSLYLSLSFPFFLCSHFSFSDLLTQISHIYLQVGSRRVIQYAGLIMLVFGLFSKFGKLYD